MANPQITYNNGAPQTLEFLNAPTSKPRFSKQATRTDTFSTAGNRQTVVERVDETHPVQMLTILAGDDSTAWQQFLDYATPGGAFEYYPDADNDAEHFTMFLADSSAVLAFSSAGIYTFSGTFQKEIT